MSDPADRSSAANPTPDDPELKKIVGEEEKVHARVMEALREVREVVPRSYDAELLELRDAISEARAEDLPPLMAEMERMRAVADRRAEVTRGEVDLSSPYFGHMKLKEGGRVRDVLIGNSTYVDTDRGVRVVDWRDAPVSRIYYRYAEGDEYEEEFGGSTLEGVVAVRRAVVLREGELRRVVAPQGSFYRQRGQWHRAEVSATKLQGGQLTAVRPPTEDERREAAKTRGRLGVGVDSKEDKHLPEIPALIDPRQFELITRPRSGMVVIQGGAGSGKTTIGLHRLAYLAFNAPKRFTPDKMLVAVFNRALASYIVRVLPGLGVEGVPVVVFTEWAKRQRERHVARAPDRYHEDTPVVATRLKKHPLMLKLIDERAARDAEAARAELERVAARSDADAAFATAWKALDGNALARRLTGLTQWMRDERSIPGAGTDPLPSRAKAELQRAIDRLSRRAKNTGYLWAELVTDPGALNSAVARWAPGAFSAEEVARAVRWSAEHCTRWVVADASDEDEDDGDKGQRAKEREARRDDRRRERARAQGFGEDELSSADVGGYDDAAQEARSLRRMERDALDDGGGGGADDDREDDASRFVAVDGAAEDDAAPAIDREDDALLLRIYQRTRGPLRGQGKQPLVYEHLFVDEAQDLSPVELAALLDTTAVDRSVTLAGDTSQRLLMDNGFSDWKGVLGELGLSTVEVEPLKIGYRSTMEVLAFAREILGPLADPDPPLATRQGAAVEFHGFPDAGAAVAFLGEALRTLSLDEPRANVAVIARDPERAGIYFRGLERSEVPRLAWVRDQDFAFRPGVEVTDIRQVKGLEFDYVILVDVTAGQYPADDESRHLLHIGATRAAHQLWVVSTGAPSPLLPKWMVED